MKFENECKEYVRLHQAKLGLKPSNEPLVMLTKFFMGDNRKRDTDNVLKAVLDSQHDVLFFNDTQVVAHMTAKFVDKAKPRIEMEVYTLAEFLKHRAEITTAWVSNDFASSEA